MAVYFGDLRNAFSLAVHFPVWQYGGMDYWWLFLAALIGAAYGFYLRFTKVGKRNVERQKQAQKDALEKRLNALSQAGIVPIEPKQKISHMVMFVITVVAIVFLVTLGMLDSFFFGAEEILVAAVIIGASLGYFFATFAAAVASKAEEAGRGWVSFFWLSLLISPLITWLIAATLKPLSSSQSPPASDPSDGGRTLEEKLTELQNLKEKGILSDDEFDKAKKKALGI